MRYSEDLVEEVRTRSDIVTVISQYVKLTRRGGDYFGICPFHNERTPSFCVTPGKQMYYCFGCGAGGNVFTFVMQYENLTFTEAMKQLAGRAGIELPETEATEEEKRQADLMSRLFQVNKEAAKYYYYQLRSPAGARAMEYLTRRGLTAETMKKFGLGSAAVGGGLYQYLKSKGYSDSLLSQSGLVKIDERGARDRFWNRAMFPIMDIRSRVIGFGGRVMGEGEPKYLNSPETKLFDKSRNLYGLNLARVSRRPYFLLCEGYMDVISLHQAGFDCAVASLGTAFTPGHASLLKRYVNEVILTYDSDGAGQKAAIRAIPILRKAGLSVRVLNMKPYKDPDEFILNLGAEAYEQRITEAVNSFLFELDVLRQSYDFSDPEKKTAFFREVAARLTQFTDELERNNYLEAAAARFQIPANSLREMVNRFGGRQVTAEREEAEEERAQRRRRNHEKDEGLREDQRLLLNTIVSEPPDLSSRIRRALTPACFADPVCRKVADRIWQAAEQGRTPEPAAILNEFLEDEETRNQAAAIFSTSLSSSYDREEKERILTDTVRRVKRRYLDQEIRKGTDDQAEMQRLILERAGLETLRL